MFSWQKILFELKSNPHDGVAKHPLFNFFRATSNTVQYYSLSGNSHYPIPFTSLREIYIAPSQRP